MAVAGGAGDFLLGDAVGSGADVFVTSDLRHHPATEFVEKGGPALVDVAHWAAEWTWLPHVEARLGAAARYGGDPREHPVHRRLDVPRLIRGDTLKADPAAQLTLLDLQELDSRADLLRHQRGTLPEHDDLAALTMTRRDLDDQARDARILVDDLTAEQTKVDADVEQVKTRRDRDRTRMDQGLVSNPKDLERMQHEMESLERRITSLEDEELEVMARLEDAQRTLDELTAQLADADARNAKLEEARDARYAEIDAELARLAEKRGPVAAGVPDDLTGALRPAPGRPRTASAPRRCGPASAPAACSASTMPSWASSAPPPRTRCSAARSASGSWSARRSRDCERAARRPHRGRRRLARQPGSGGVRRRAQGRRHRPR